MPSCSSQDVDRFIETLPSYDAVFYKALASNDHTWVYPGKSHQAGVLIPRQTVSFFGIDPAADMNKMLELTVRWLLGGSIFTREDMPNPGRYRNTRIRYYCGGNRKRRPESHLTCVYAPYFENLTDGAILFIGRRTNAKPTFDALIIEPNEEALLERMITAVGLPDSLSWGVVPLTRRAFLMPINLGKLIDDLTDQLYNSGAKLPTTEATADVTWSVAEEYADLVRTAIPYARRSKNPFETGLQNRPGDLIRWLHEQVGFTLLKAIELRHYPPQICNRIQTGTSTYPESWQDLTRAIGNTLEEIITISKSITQSRRTRAGQSFEHLVARFLQWHNIKFQRQAGEGREDFLVHSCHHGKVILSAKTSTRERWKQVSPNSFFITLDRTVGPDKLGKIIDQNLCLVVPESDKKDISHYKTEKHVLTYKDFISRVT